MAGPGSKDGGDGAAARGAAAGMGANFGEDLGADLGADAGADLGPDLGADLGAEFGTEGVARASPVIGPVIGPENGTDADVGADVGADIGAVVVAGAHLWRGWLSRPAQLALVAELRAILVQAPLVTPVTPRGRPMSVRMSACGRLGWVTDRKGYRYEPRHPSGIAWPPLPAAVRQVWRSLSGWPTDPDCCLINWYGAQARMGLHQDRDEGDFSAPVLSISLGDTGVFRIGRDTRGGPTTRIDLRSGDVLALTGPSRLAYHGLARILPGSSDLLDAPGRINLTCRVVASR
ncbi:MAG: alpha-ketoglutarate-dependent dioxygenase AlkB [Pseudomonadota bacterium]